ncbi:MAG TPA: hypothetical protein VMS17_26685 [Gemmataceae bacterium]|nr:hypothetical protein [Gemmataceae bacterium]
MMPLYQIKRRVGRLRELAEAFGREVKMQQDNQLLLPAEHRAYMNALHGAIQGFDDARHVLVKVVERMRRERR